MALSVTVRIKGELVLGGRGTLELVDVGIEGHGVFWWSPMSGALAEKIAVNSEWMRLAADVRIRISPNRPLRGRRTIVQVEAPREEVPIERKRAARKRGAAGNGPEVIRRR